MSTGLIRAALCSILSDCAVYGERSANIHRSISVFLERFSNDSFIREFDFFAETLYCALQQCVHSVTSKKYRAKSALREKLWVSFHNMRENQLKVIWEKFCTSTKTKFDPFIQQTVNMKVYEEIIKAHFEVSPNNGTMASSSPPQLSVDEENIVRYAAGYVSMRLLKKYENLCTEKAMQYVAVNGDESSLLEYTTHWSSLINRGGLFEINDDTYKLFHGIELRVQKHLLSFLNDSILPDKKDIIINAVAEDENVQQVWAQLSHYITEEDHAIQLLRELISLWITVRGFAIAGTWVEQY
ncbi:hypothetical protein SPONN_19 [uncultured Candidatus Thioglobus sp.]|nr:hypothetical protein SPONN_19 [uncultured Candidatus Thioglobus sp.]